MRDFPVTAPNGTKWWVIWDRVEGLTCTGSTIFVDGALHNAALLRVMTHESLHAAFPSLTEKEVVDAAAFISEILWKAGYRQAPKRATGKRKTRR
jgi:hypothetical protein